jgi:beta-glucanase (GH16 family)
VAYKVGKNLSAALAALSVLFAPWTAVAAEIDWAGIKWEIRTGSGNPCATGIWSEKGVWVDHHGWLHLKIVKLPSGQFACAEITALKRFGFGRYEVEVQGPIGAIDRNVVLGIFTYPPKDVGPDGTNEIDIEIARWGHSKAPQINYTAWFRSRKGRRYARVQVPNDLTDAAFRMIWQPEQVRWESSLPNVKPFTLKGDIANQPQLLKINLWLFKEQQPFNQQETEFIIKSLRYL